MAFAEFGVERVESFAGKRHAAVHLPERAAQRGFAAQGVSQTLGIARHAAQQCAVFLSRGQRLRPASVRAVETAQPAELGRDAGILRLPGNDARVQTGESFLHVAVASGILPRLGFQQQGLAGHGVVFTKRPGALVETAPVERRGVGVALLLHVDEAQRALHIYGVAMTLAKRAAHDFQRLHGNGFVVAEIPARDDAAGEIIHAAGGHGIPGIAIGLGRAHHFENEIARAVGIALNDGAEQVHKVAEGFGMLLAERLAQGVENSLTFLRRVRCRHAAALNVAEHGLRRKRQPVLCAEDALRDAARALREGGGLLRFAFLEPDGRQRLQR